MAASSRLKNNLEDAESLPSVLNCDYQTEWDRWSSIIKFTKTYCPPKLKRSQVLNKVYYINAKLDASGDGDGSGDGGDEGGDGDGPGDEEDSDSGPSDDEAPDPKKPRREGGGGDGGDGGDGGHDGAYDGATAEEIEAPNERQAALIREWLYASLAVQSFISITLQSEDNDGQVVKPFQVLEIKRGRQVVLFDEVQTTAPELGLVGLQPLERWLGASDGTGLPDTIDTFVLEEPCTADVLHLIGTKREARKKLIQWTPAMSDVQGCVALANPQPVKCKVSLGDEKVPFLALVDELEDQGFVGVDKKVRHGPGDAGKQYDARSTFRTYLQCVITQESLFRAGCKMFPSDGLSIFYKCLMRFPTVAADLSSQEYKNMLRSGRKSLTEIELQRRYAAPVPFAMPKQASRRSAGARPPRSSSSSASSTSSSSSSASSSSATLLMDGGGHAGSDTDSDEDFKIFPKLFFGKSLQRQVNVKNGVRHKGLMVFCNNPARNTGPIPCKKYRALRLDAHIHGERSALYFLGAWMLKSETMPSHLHRKDKPTIAEVTQFKETFNNDAAHVEFD